MCSQLIILRYRKGTERLRFTPSPLHSDKDIDHLVNALNVLWKQCAIARVVA